MNKDWPQTKAQRNPSQQNGQNRNAALLENAVEAPSHYVWEVPDKSIAVHISFDLIDRLSQEVMRGFGAVPRRGAEVGGVLLGSIDAGEKMVVRIEDFQQVPCDYKRGPSFLLTDSDGLRMAGAVAKHTRGGNNRNYAVGFFRSHTRDGLGLSDEDVDLFREYFKDQGNVLLLVRPFATKASVAGFFFEEEGGMRQDASYLEFPFRRKDLGGGTVTAARTENSARELGGSGPRQRERTGTREAEADPRKSVSEEQEAAPRQLSLQNETPAALPRLVATRGQTRTVEDGENLVSAAKFRSKWVWLPLSFVFLLLGVVVGFQAALTFNRGESERLAQQSLMLSLSAQKEADGVVIRWDRRSAAVENAKNGFLHIQDGDFRKTVPLAVTQLKTGSVIYRSTESLVSFRLEVFTQERGSISESVEYSPAVR